MLIDCSADMREVIRMSSTPFNLGLPVVDSVPPEGGEYVLRAKDESDLSRKIQTLQTTLSKNDLIKIFFIGYRPDRPIPVSRFFDEISVEIGKAEVWNKRFGLWNYSLWHRIATGMRGEQDDQS
jgi:hypothetical protein